MKMLIIVFVGFITTLRATSQPTTKDSVWLEYSAGILTKDRLRLARSIDAGESNYLKIVEALMLLDDGQVRDAHNKIRESGSVVPSNNEPLYWQALGKAYILDENYDSAITVYEKILTEQGPSYELYSNIGYCLFQSKRQNDAKSNFDLAYSIVSDSVAHSKRRDYHKCAQLAILANMSLIDGGLTKQKHLYDSSLRLECGPGQLAYIYYASIISSRQISSAEDLLKGIELAIAGHNTFLAGMMLKEALAQSQSYRGKLIPLSHILKSKNSNIMRMLAYEYLFAHYVQTNNNDSSNFYYLKFKSLERNELQKRDATGKSIYIREMSEVAKKAESLIAQSEKRARKETRLYLTLLVTTVLAILGYIVARIIKKRRRLRG
jgi:tetratricopeptide (TPR) repeat protein